MDESILLRYLQGGCTETECREVEAWVSSQPENRETLEQLYYTRFVADRAEVFAKVDTEASLSRLKAEIKKKERPSGFAIKRLYRYAGLAAAFLAGAIFTGGTAYYLTSDRFTDYTVSTLAGQRAQTTLPDGSKVWLNASTQLTYKNSLWSADREVALNGEAYFEVSHNKRRPFIVSSKRIKTRVLGTKFNVRARQEENHVTTTLLQGSVRMESPKRPEGYLLKPGQTLNINTETFGTEWKTYSSPADVLVWMNGRLHFDRHTLQAITSLMEKVYDIQFVFTDPSLRSEQFTGDFSVDSTPNEILDVLSLTHHFNYKRKGNTIYLIKE